ncbi:hypothetical protein ACOSQ3_000231 [Xanthoceras sorbifolium]
MIFAVRLETVAMQPEKPAPLVRDLIDSDEQEKIHQATSAFAEPEAVQEQTKQRLITLHACFVHDRYYYSLVLHGRPGECRFKLISTDCRVSSFPPYIQNKNHIIFN